MITYICFQIFFLQNLTMLKRQNDKTDINRIDKWKSFTYQTHNDSALRDICVYSGKDRRIATWTQRCCSSAGRCTWTGIRLAFNKMIMVHSYQAYHHGSNPHCVSFVSSTQMEKESDAFIGRDFFVESRFISNSRYSRLAAVITWDINHKNVITFISLVLIIFENFNLGRKLKIVVADFYDFYSDWKNIFTYLYILTKYRICRQNKYIKL